MLTGDTSAALPASIHRAEEVLQHVRQVLARADRIEVENGLDGDGILSTQVKICHQGAYNIINSPLAYPSHVVFVPRLTGYRVVRQGFSHIIIVFAALTLSKHVVRAFPRSAGVIEYNSSPPTAVNLGKGRPFERFRV